MNLKIDVNINVSNVEAIVDRISKIMDLSRLSLDDNNKLGDKAYKEEVTMDKLRCILIDLSKIGKSQEAKGVLEKYNATKIPQLDKSDYNKVYNELINLKQLS